MIKVKRTYEQVEPGDGTRFLVDRLWPRGIKKADLEIEAWLKEVAPSDELRKWYRHDPEKWEEFKRRYKEELQGKAESWQPILKAAQEGDVTLLYSSKEKEYNNAVALKEFLEEERKAPTG